MTTTAALIVESNHGVLAGQGADEMPRKPRTKPRDTDAEAAITVRFPEALVERIDRQLAKEQERRPGMKTSRADVIRTLLFEALEAREGAKNA